MTAILIIKTKQICKILSYKQAYNENIQITIVFY